MAVRKGFKSPSRSVKSDRRVNLLSPWGTTIESVTKPYQYRTSPGGPWTSASITSDRNRKARVVGPNGVKSLGWLPPTTMSGIVKKQTSKPFDFLSALYAGGPRIVQVRSDEGWFSSRSIYSCGHNAQLAPLTSFNMESRAQTEALNKIKDNDLNVATSVAELDQTLGQIAQTVLVAYRALKAVRRKDWNGLAKALFRDEVSRKKGKIEIRRGNYAEGISNRWLEYQYGWKPLFSDLSALLDLARQQKRSALIVTAIRDLRETLPLPKTSAPYWGRITGSIETGCYCRLDCVITNPQLATLDQLGLTNPFSLGWELVPYSFVIDWLIPIGNCLQALTASAGISFKGGSLTSWTYADVNEVSSHPWYDVAIGAPNNSRVESLCWKRTLYGSLPMPRLYIKSPFNSLTRFATALALHHTGKPFR